MAYYLNSEFESAYLAHSTSANDDNLAAQFGLDSSTLYSTSSIGLPTNAHASHHAQNSPRTFPAFDAQSPFNTSAGLARAIGRDGRLKTRLMGIGSEGGYLTSPLIVGNRKGSDSMFQQAVGFASPAATPDLKVDSPEPSNVGGDSLDEIADFVDDAPTTRAMEQLHQPRSRQISASMGLGMGISGVNALQQARDLGDSYTTSASPPARPTSRGPRTRSASGQSAASGRVTRSRAHNVIEDENDDSIECVDAVQYPTSPPLATVAPPATGRRPKKPLPLKTINRAKSCSALSPLAQQAQQPSEPLTPTSARSMQFSMSGLPLSSPAEDMAAQAALAPSMFSFSDLYNFELSTEGASRKNSDDFVNGLLVNEASGLANNNFSKPEPARDVEYASAHQLPTPYLAPSGFSSPSTEYVSDPSPEIGMFRSPTHMSSVSMLSAPSMDSNFSLPIPDSTSQLAHVRQRAITYDSRPITSSGDNEILQVFPPPPPLMQPPQSSSMQPPQSSSMQHRQLSSISAYGPSAKFAYPSRYMHPKAAQAPAMSWAHSVPPSVQQQQQQQQQQHQQPTHQQFIQQYANVDPAMFVPSYEQVQQRHNSDVYERNLEAFDDMYERYGGQGTQAPSAIYATPGKRVRTVDDDDVDLDYEDHVGGFRADTMAAETTPRTSGRIRYATNIFETPEQPAAKRLRTVASAPCLPTKRMRPGPKPKPKSPGQQHESVFSAKSLSPRQAQLPAFVRAMSPFSDGGQDDDDPRRPRGSVPKEVIESLYRGVPSHVDENGEKVAKRYFCLMEGCDRAFPRKSAIESHIQTHLEDKPYVCSEPDCDASFVRQHDLRRHQRIHSDHKPFSCPCGKGFARGDALARHRARGICSGSVVPRRG
ncbi:Metallothionein expression activator [Microbotryomycetes sp. JL201]|nr:Metallothionein expression activator [Microbotryomycetes sp. JL201]